MEVDAIEAVYKCLVSPEMLLRDLFGFNKTPASSQPSAGAVQASRIGRCHW